MCLRSRIKLMLPGCVTSGKSIPPVTRAGPSRRPTTRDTLGHHHTGHQITGWVNAGALRALARQAVKGVAWEGPGTRFAALSVGSRGFVNRQTLSESKIAWLGLVLRFFLGGIEQCKELARCHGWDRQGVERGSIAGYDEIRPRFESTDALNGILEIGPAQ